MWLWFPFGRSVSLLRIVSGSRKAGESHLSLTTKWGSYIRIRIKNVKQPMQLRESCLRELMRHCSKEQLQHHRKEIPFIFLCPHILSSPFSSRANRVELGLFLLLLLSFIIDSSDLFVFLDIF